MIQDPVGIKNNVETLVQEQLDQLRWCLLRMLAWRLLAVAAKRFLRQLIQLPKERFGAWERGLRVFTNLGKSLGQEVAGGFDQ